MSEEQQAQETVSDNLEVSQNENLGDTLESKQEFVVDSATSVEVDLEAEENDGKTSPEQEEIFAAFQQENANLKKLLDEKSNQADLTKAQYARLAADFENFRRRTAKEKENLEEQAKKMSLLFYYQ